MRRITEVLRLAAQGLSYRQIGQSVGISASTVQGYLHRAQSAGVTWPLPDDLDYSVLEERLFKRSEEEMRPGRPEPDWLDVHRERKRGKHVTLQLLHLEYKATHPDGLGYTQFCTHYRHQLEEESEVNDRPQALTRRSLLAVAGTLAGSAALVGVASAQPAAQVPDDPTKVQGRPPNEIGDRSPFEQPRRTPSATSSQTPLDLLNGIITPSDLHYERHHAGVPLIDPSRYTLTIHGMVDRPTVYTLEDLKRFPSIGRIMFLECSGNSGAGWAKGPPTGTAQTLHGLTSTSDWTGVPVSTLMNEVGVQSGAVWALAEGEDAAVLTRSVPVAKLMDDAFIAYGQNGEALRPEQGYPARLLLPGWEGNINVKWIRRLKFGDQPFETREETSKYTDPMPDSSARQFTFAMEAKSTITWPTTQLGVMPSLGPWEIRGIAWSGRGRITRVEVSADGGQTWADARLVDPVLPIAHTRFLFPWTWTGTEAILVSRATDETGYVQPSRDELVAARGTGSIYHYNGQQNWRIAPNGTITNYYAG